MFKGVIPAVRGPEHIQAVAATGHPVVFLLAGEILDLQQQIERLKTADKKVLVHFDLIAGLGRDEAAVRYVAAAGADGIVSSRTNIIKAAREQGMLTVQRLFLLDSASVETGLRMVAGVKPDAVEILPGLVLPWVIGQLRQQIKCTIIAGGLIKTVEDVNQVLAAGAKAVSCSRAEIWRHFDKEVK